MKSIHPEDSPRSLADPRLRRRQGLTMGLLIVGYMGYYLCRSDLAVATPLIVEELAARGMGADAAKVRLGGIATAGILAYAVGKLLGGTVGDFLGGRRNFLLGMAGAVAFTLLFAAGGSVPFWRGIDSRHEDHGGAWLAAHFDAEVVEPTRLHVAAKRYLCAVDAGYRGRLSPASLRRIPGLHIASRWHGTYAKHPNEPYFVARPADGAVVVTCAGGAGMTLSFGLAERVVGDVLEGSP